MIVCSCNILSDHDVRAAVRASEDLPPNAKQVYGCLGCSAESKISKILIGASRCPQTCVSPSQMARPNWNAFATVIKGLLPQAIADLIAIIRAKDDLIC